jgi:hypothetical protein
MLACVIDAVEGRDVAIIDVPNAFVQTVVEDEEHRVIICIRGPLVEILVSIAPEVYGSYVSTNTSGQKVLLVQCLNAVYGTMVAALLYYKKFVKSLTVALLRGIFISSKRRFALSGIVYPLNEYRALWLSVWYCISLNL